MTQTASQAPYAVPDTQGMTPMMAQFFEIKAVNPGYLLFYRMGDFYELFFEDAEIASAALGITLTKRGRHMGEDIPMCGVPIHAAQDYLRKLIGLGHRVAVCEQVEDPAEAKKRGSKSVVKRDVVRLVTPGTLTEDDLLPARGNNFLACLARLGADGDGFALAWADISTGDLLVADISADILADEIARIDPAELAVSDRLADQFLETRALSAERLATISRLPHSLFDSEAGAGLLRETFRGDVDPTAFSRTARAALGALIAYVADTQKGISVSLRPPRLEALSAHMQIDAATRASLELLVTQRGESRGSLRSTIDLTMTGAGARLFAARLAAPLNDPAAINARLDTVSALLERSIETDSIRKALRSAPDMARALTRLTLERGGPRDLAAIGRGIVQARALAATLATFPDCPEGLKDIAAGLERAPQILADEFAVALVEEPPLLARDGGFVAAGYEAELDTQRRLGSESRKVVAELQAELVDLTGVKALKIKHNNVLGFFVEVPASHGNKLLEHERFIHRQTLANAMRFTTGELAELEGRIARAQETAVEIETAIFARLRDAVLRESRALVAAADAMAGLDVAAALATLAAERGYARPVVDQSLAFAIEGGRHPVVEKTLQAGGKSFVANDCTLSAPETGDGGQLWLVTGPNMGGKSTFLRQNALIAIMAQMGGFVPAVAAHIGVVDRVFSRVGASDDIAQGRSTFMVEMVETAAILNRASRQSLVILDEIGRGTATYDGLSIAWACVETLHETTGCRALFATHYHELTALAGPLARVSNHTMSVREYRGDVIFLHEVVPGAADRSYGIQVARLAGLPAPVIARARQVLDLLEAQGQSNPGSALADLPLFAHMPAPASPPPQPRDNPVAAMVEAVRPDDLTPRAALDWIYELKKAAHADGDH
ncbi:DNA mismatch repair protein MutS [Pelagibacterium lacus]|uniref:DNA mismatch repair protein MutS n=1 Tax=Pelagibacterium lacus TaxID=2282655 RepID=A0A369W6L5_9HYPH|nr:DNA mismatch repair protein MutS [Pelagibacterium lacus]RDE09495.1 DNA mismatch repair protein MutS [Pelagibacterium lacus]